MILFHYQNRLIISYSVTTDQKLLGNLGILITCRNWHPKESREVAGSKEILFIFILSLRQRPGIQMKSLLVTFRKYQNGFQNDL
jgi:hypothetical protein